MLSKNFVANVTDARMTRNIPRFRYPCAADVCKFTIF